MAEENQINNNNNANNSSGNKARRQQQRGKKQQSKHQKNNARKEEAVASNKGGQQQQHDNKSSKKKNHNNKKRYRGRDRKPWRKHIPKGTVDPITLEELSSLSYPPFALYAAGPYLPVPQWPPKQQTSAAAPIEEDPKQRELKLLREQWGSAAALPEEDSKPQAARPTDHRSFNLFDGRALAYYMVSQQQFIDPLNRRDLDRDELVHLDRYLKKHGFDANVVEAYDTKGISLSMAGAASTTAAGRAQMLQEEAQNLLNALFVRPTNSLAQQYNRYQQQGQEQPSSRPTTARAAGATSSSESEESDEDGWGNTIYGNEDDGMMVIDDDENPSMRGDAVARTPDTPAETDVELFPALVTSDSEPKATERPNNLWAGHKITANQTTNLKDQNFPALAGPTSAKVKTANKKSNAAAEAQRQRQLLEEQWGSAAGGVVRRQAATASKPIQQQPNNLQQNFPLVPLTSNRCTTGAPGARPSWGKPQTLNAW